MKITVDQHALVDAVNWVSRSLPVRPIKPELLGIHIDATGSTITLSASDHETSSKAVINADIFEKGEVLVPGKLLAEITRSLPNKPISLTLEGSRVNVTSGSAKFALPTLSLSEYPTLPELPAGTGMVDGDLFAQAVSQVAIAASRDESLLNLTGVHVEINGDAITLAATDRYRLAVRELNWTPETPGTATTALLRARTFAEAAKSLAGAKTISLSFAPSTSSDRITGFAADGKSMTSRLLDGAFPSFAHIMPTESLTTAVIEVEPFLESVKRVALVTDKTVPLRLEFADNGVTIEAGVGQEASASERVDLLLKGDPITIGFNPQYLAEGLQALGTPFVHISFTQSSKPAVLTGRMEPNGNSNDNYRYLLMPMRYA